MMKTNGKKIFNFFLLLIITSIVLYFSLKDDFNTIINEIFNMNPIWLLVSVLLLICYWLFKSIVTHRLIIKFNKEYSLKKAIRLMLITNFFNAITPFASGGQPFEIYSLNKDKVKVTDASNIVIQNFIVYQIALVILGIIAILYNYFFDLFKDNSVLKNLVTLGFIINFLVIVVLFILTFAKKLNKVIINFFIKVLSKLRIIKDKNKVMTKFDNYLFEFHTGAKILLKNKAEFISMILLQFLGLICLYLIPLTLLYATNDYTSFNGIEAIVTSAYVMLIGSFVPIPGGTGGLEYGFIAFYNNFLKGSSLNAIMLVWRFITYYLGIIIGAIILNFRKKEN